MGKKVSAATMSDMARGRRPTDATAAAVDSARRRVASAWALWLLLPQGKRPPTAVAAVLVATARGRADLYRVVRSIGAHAPLERPAILDATTQRIRPRTPEDFAEMIDTLRVAYDIAETAHARAACGNARGVVMARYFRALGNQGIQNGFRARAVRGQ